MALSVKTSSEIMYMHPVSTAVPVDFVLHKGVGRDWAGCSVWVQQRYRLLVDPEWFPTTLVGQLDLSNLIFLCPGVHKCLNLSLSFEEFQDNPINPVCFNLLDPRDVREYGVVGLRSLYQATPSHPTPIFMPLNYFDGFPDGLLSWLDCFTVVLPELSLPGSLTTKNLRHLVLLQTFMQP